MGRNPACSRLDLLKPSRQRENAAPRRIDKTTEIISSKMSHRFRRSGLVLALAVTSPLCAQLSGLHFEVASIRLSKNPEPGGNVDIKPGRFRGKDLALQWLILTAYRIRSDDLSGDLPNWTISERYDIDAETDGPAKEDQVLLALQNLLADRFHLKLHREVRQEPVYLLTVAKSGVKMPPGGCVPRKQDLPNECYSARNEGLIETLDWRGVALSAPQGVAYRSLVWALSGALHRPVIDKTGLTGAFDVHLRWAREPQTPFFARGDSSKLPDPAELGVPSIFDAVEKQLGLKLESGRGPVEHMIVDHVEKPDEN